MPIDAHINRFCFARRLLKTESTTPPAEVAMFRVITILIALMPTMHAKYYSVVSESSVTYMITSLATSLFSSL